MAEGNETAGKYAEISQKEGEKSKKGRRLYSEEEIKAHLENLEMIRLQGGTRSNFAQKIGINESTVRGWEKRPQRLKKESATGSLNISTDNVQESTSEFENIDQATDEHNEKHEEPIWILEDIKQSSDERTMQCRKSAHELKKHEKSAEERKIQDAKSPQELDEIKLFAEEQHIQHANSIQCLKKIVQSANEPNNIRLNEHVQDFKKIERSVKEYKLQDAKLTQSCEIDQSAEECNMRAKKFVKESKKTEKFAKELNEQDATKSIPGPIVQSTNKFNIQFNEPVQRHKKIEKFSEELNLQHQKSAQGPRTIENSEEQPDGLIMNTQTEDHSRDLQNQAPRISPFRSSHYFQLEEQLFEDYDWILENKS